MYDIAIIGAGASGLTAAIQAKRTEPSLRVALIEALPRVGKKILATGNGRCNLTNYHWKKGNYSNFSFASSVLNRYHPHKITEFFASIGLLCHEDSEGRVYPMSNTAASVLECLRLEIERLGVDVLQETPVTSLKKNGGVFLINSDIRAKNVIVCGGGKASPSQGSNGSCYSLIEGFGHRITRLYPGLVQLTAEENFVKSLKGVRVKANIELYVGSELADRSSGEVLFTDYGISGIAAMDISRTASRLGGVCKIDLLPKLSEEEITAFLSDRQLHSPSTETEKVLIGLLPSAMGKTVVKRLPISPDTPIAKLNKQEVSRISREIKNFKLTVTGTKGFANAQITVGGADVKQFNRETLESLKVKGLYCAGEILDVDAVCGGYNLQWAWASGLTAGEKAAESCV